MMYGRQTFGTRFCHMQRSHDKQCWPHLLICRVATPRGRAEAIRHKADAEILHAGRSVFEGKKQAGASDERQPRARYAKPVAGGHAHGPFPPAFSQRYRPSPPNLFWPLSRDQRCRSTLSSLSPLSKCSVPTSAKLKNMMGVINSTGARAAGTSSRTYIGTIIPDRTCFPSISSRSTGPCGWSR